MPPDSAHVVVTLPEIYRKVLETDDKVDRLATSVEQMVAVNRRLDEHRERIEEHGNRLRKVEAQITAQWVVVGAVVAVAVTAVGRILFTL